MSKLKLNYNNTFATTHSRDYYRGASFHFSGKWLVGAHYTSDDYIVDFVVHDQVLLACAKSHLSTVENEPIEYIKDERGDITGVVSTYWDFVLSGIRGDSASVKIVDNYWYVCNNANDPEESQIWTNTGIKAKMELSDLSGEEIAILQEPAKQVVENFIDNNIVQISGDSEDLVMSQKAVSEAIDEARGVLMLNLSNTTSAEECAKSYEKLLNADPDHAVVVIPVDGVRYCPVAYMFYKDDSYRLSTAIHTGAVFRGYYWKLTRTTCSMQIYSLAKTDVIQDNNSNVITSQAVFKALEKKANVSDIASVFRVKGSVYEEEQLPDDAQVGDVYNINENGANYVWNGTKWDKLSETVDLSAILDELTWEHGYEVNSIVQKDTGASAISEASIAAGKGSIAGIRGFYYKHIAVVNSTIVNIYFSQTQGKPTMSTTSVTKDTTIVPKNYWTVGDIISIVNDSKYDNKLRIVQFLSEGGGVQAVWVNGSAEFDAIKSATEPYTAEDYSVYCLSKPDKGPIDLSDSNLAVGTESRAVGGNSVALGYKNESWGKFAFTEGRENKAWYASHAEGYNSEATGHTSHAEGWRTLAGVKNSGSSLSNAPAVNNGTVEGNYTHSEGNGTWAKGNSSHAEGVGTQAFGYGSHAEGYHCLTTTLGEHAEGTFNVSTNNTIHTVGMGISETTRRNAHTITKDGRHYIPGIGTYQGTEQLLPTGQDLASVINSKMSAPTDADLLTDDEMAEIFAPTDRKIRVMLTEDFAVDEDGNYYDKDDYAGEKWGGSFEEMMADADLGELEYAGMNRFDYTEEELNYNGKVYEMWKLAYRDIVMFGLVDPNLTDAELEENSMASDIDNNFIPFAAIVNEDSSIRYNTSDDLNKYALVKCYETY